MKKMMAMLLVILCYTRTALCESTGTSNNDLSILFFSILVSGIIIATIIIYLVKCEKELESIRKLLEDNIHKNIDKKD